MPLPRHPIAAQRARNVRIREHAERIACALPAASPHGPVPVAIVPANTRETEPLPPAVRKLFLDRLLTLMLAERALPPRDAEAAGGEPPAFVPSESQRGAPRADTPDATDHDTNVTSVLGNACTTCRGACCTAGGNHAFLRGENLERILQSHPAESAHSLHDTYAALLPERHYRGSCVYHTTSGCALPRTLRADLCNRYACGGLTQLKSALSLVVGLTAYVGAADSAHLRRLAIIDPSRISAVPLR